jgi:hypothetical protein
LALSADAVQVALGLQVVLQVLGPEQVKRQSQPPVGQVLLQVLPAGHDSWQQGEHDVAQLLEQLAIARSRAVAKSGIDDVIAMSPVADMAASPGSVIARSISPDEGVSPAMRKLHPATSAMPKHKRIIAPRFYPKTMNKPRAAASEPPWHDAWPSRW